MAAYASLVSLLNTLNLIQNHPFVCNVLNKWQNEYLREKVDFFLDFVENYSNLGSREAQDLMMRIAFVAHAAEDIIECLVAHRVRAGSTEKRLSMLLVLLRILDDMDSIKEKVIKVEEKAGFMNRQPTYSMPPPASSSVASTATKTTTMVGFDGYRVQLLDELTGQQSEQRIIPIVGMGGIGKTTLARNVYENLLIVQYFDVRAWITVSQNYNARDILLEALSCTGESTSKLDARTEDQLGEQLHKTLSGRRYLIVLDDAWSVEVWDRMKFFFPENNNGSRIIITTRLSELVSYFGSCALYVNFLDDNKSWDLFCEKTFAPQEGCPSELEEIGKKIVKKCRGLPLAIVVIGGLLGKSSKTEEYWEEIAKDISLILNSREGSKLFSILHLSYKHLPACLKSCFLHLGLFPEDYEICVSQLTKLWVAEGIIKPNMDQCLEEIAEGYVKELVDRNLLLVRRFRPNRRFKTCCLHDLVRDLSIRIGERENFVCVQRDIDGRRHFTIDKRTSSFYCRDFHRQGTPSIIHHLVFRGPQKRTPFRSRLVRVVARDVGDLDYSFQEVSLRFLNHESMLAGLNRIRTYQFPPSISLLWSLQTLIIRGIVTVVAPSEIWKMPQLRHIDIGSLNLSDPPPSGEQEDVIILQNLQTLKCIQKFKCTKEICKRIPKIKEMEFDPCSRQSLYNVCSLTKLESISFSCSRLRYIYNPLKKLKLLTSLRKLTLGNCKLSLRDMKTIGSLPRLETLNLTDISVVGSKWKSAEEKFLSLKHLKISVSRCYGVMIRWIADCSHFLVLETLSLGCISDLDEIPLGIGEIPTLQIIDIFDCSESVYISAIKILEEQESLGNQLLQFEVNMINRTQAKEFREEMELKGFTHPNMHITSSRPW